MTLLAFGDGESISEERYFGDTVYYVLEVICLCAWRARGPPGRRGLSGCPGADHHAIGGSGPFKLLQITIQSN